MKSPSWLVFVPLFAIVWITSMLASGWPYSVAYATGGHPSRDAGHAAVVRESDENEANENNNDEDDGDNDSDENQNSNESDENNNGNDNKGDVHIVPVPVTVPAPTPVPPPAPAVSPVDVVSQCLANGGTLFYHGPDGGIAVKSFQDNLNVTISRINPTSVPLPPGVPVGNWMFQLAASPCGGAPYTVLPSEVNLAVAYSDALAVGRDENRFTLMFYNGTAWAPAPKLYRDPATNHVSASVTGLGVYALVQQ